jgi:polysaccharide export outer membrane protein
LTGIKRTAALTGALALFFACATPANISYLQDVEEGTTFTPPKASSIRLQPMDQISIVVSCRDPQVAAMFNLPMYTRRIGEQASLSTGVSSGSTGMSGYTVKSDGTIDFPIIGSIDVAGLTREETEDLIKEKLVDSRQIKDPVVTVEFMNLGFSVLGEVASPGRYAIDRDKFTILDALGRAGDLTINGMRENVTLLRKEGLKDQVYRINLLNGQQLYGSPAFYVQQGDIIYVTPNEKRIRESTINGNTVRSTSFWISLSSLATSVIVLIINTARLGK